MKISRITHHASHTTYHPSAMALPEMMVAIGVASLLLMVMATVFMTSTRGFAAMGNYVEMDTSSRVALDHMTTQIRQAAGLTEFSSSHLKFATAGNTNSFLVYDYDSTSGSLTEWKTGDATTNTLLTGCNQLTFSLYNSAFAATTDMSQCKGLSVNWKCSRTVLSSKNTEDMQQALIVLRNQPPT